MFRRARVARASIRSTVTIVDQPLDRYVYRRSSLPTSSLVLTVNVGSRVPWLKSGDKCACCEDAPSGI